MFAPGPPVIEIIFVPGLTLLAVSIATFPFYRKTHKWKWGFAISLALIAVPYLWLLPIMYDLRHTKNVAMNFTQDIHQNALFSGIKCINDERSETCTAQEYKYSALITYPDGAEHNINADKITRTRIHNVRTEFELLHIETYSLSVAKAIYSKFLEPHKNRGGYLTERSIVKSKIIQKKFTNNKTLGWSDGFEWDDKVCIAFKEYDSCISLYGRDRIQIYEYIVLSFVKHS